MVDHRDFKDPVTANERAVAIEKRERYVPIVLGIAAGTLIVCAVMFAFAH